MYCCVTVVKRLVSKAVWWAICGIYRYSITCQKDFITWRSLSVATVAWGSEKTVCEYGAFSSWQTALEISVEYQNITRNITLRDEEINKYVQNKMTNIQSTHLGQLLLFNFSATILYVWIWSKTLLKKMTGILTSVWAERLHLSDMIIGI